MTPTIPGRLVFPAAEPRLVSQHGAFVLLFPTFAIFWFLGLGMVFWPLVGLLAGLSLLARRALDVPRRFGLWLLFLLWIPLSIIQLEEQTEAMVFLHRLSVIVAATTIFLYIFNADRIRLPDSAVINALAFGWAILIVGGLVAVLLPHVQFHTAFESLLPASLRANAYVHGGVHVAFADVNSFLGFPVGRPRIFFTATNAWGAMVALLTPFAFAALEQVTTTLRRRVLQILLPVSLVPIVFSLNRGLWLALAVAGLYVLFRFVHQFNLRRLAAVAAVTGVGAAVVFATSLGGLIGQRLETGHSDESRRTLVAEGFKGVKESPLIGHGRPRELESQAGTPLPPIGTHSHLLYIAYSHGIPALLFAASWLVLTLLVSRRARTGPLFWAHLGVLVFVIEMPYYLLEAHLPVLMIVGALIWRSVAYRSVAPRNPYVATVRSS
jgi:polysaccharide biosynthesis protein PslJ